MKKGFTIIELLAVIGIISVLVTIVVTAAGGSIKSARERRTESMRIALEQGIIAFYAQTDEWPSTIESHIEDVEDTIKFEGTDADAIFREIVARGFGSTKSPLVDASALFVCSASQANKENAVGCDFPVAANRNSKYFIPFSSMAFGYPESDHGRFRRFNVVYRLKADTVSVQRQTK